MGQIEAQIPHSNGQFQQVDHNNDLRAAQFRRGIDNDDYWMVFRLSLKANVYDSAELGLGINATTH